MREGPQPERIGDYQTRLDRIEAAVNEIHVPLAFFHEAYNLKQHINLVRGKLARLSEISAVDRPSTPGADRRKE